MGTAKAKAVNIIEEVSASVERWRSFASLADVPSEKAEAIEKVFEELKRVRG